MVENLRMFTTFNNFILEQRRRRVGSTTVQNIYARGSELMRQANLRETNLREGYIGPNFLFDPKN